MELGERARLRWWSGTRRESTGAVAARRAQPIGPAGRVRGNMVDGRTGTRQPCAAVIVASSTCREPHRANTSSECIARVSRLPMQLQSSASLSQSLTRHARLPGPRRLRLRARLCWSTLRPGRRTRPAGVTRDVAAGGGRGSDAGMPGQVLYSYIGLQYGPTPVAEPVWTGEPDCPEA